MKIRTEQTSDYEAVYNINCAAFSTSAEANLVNCVRDTEKSVSLVAEVNGSIVGHILFTPVTLIQHPSLQIAGLAPMAVNPSNQRQGIGSALIKSGIETVKSEGYGAVVVLGHVEYYPKFGFKFARDYKIAWEHGHDDAFMLLELEPNYLKGLSGIIKYHPSFDEV